jgi:hypothetical protein
MMLLQPTAASDHNADERRTRECRQQRAARSLTHQRLGALDRFVARRERALTESMRELIDK